MQLIKLLFLCLLFMAPAAMAQEDLAVYKVTDVIVDVTSGSASLARDSAMIQAQRASYGMLLERLGATGSAAKASDDVIASLVQAMDVQKEHAAGVRYLGTFSVQFKPDAVRNFLSGKGVTFVEARARPMVVLPILRSNGRDTMWEDMTPWHEAWANAAKNAGLVPMLMPQGDLDDIAKIGAPEALGGKQENILAIMQKYEASGVVVPLLQADLAAPDGKKEAVVDVLRFDETGKPLDTIHFSLPPLTSPKAVPDILSNGARQIIGQVERGWRQSKEAPSGPANFLPVDVAVPTLAAWTQIRNRMKQVSAVAGSHIITMTRGLVHAEIEFRGDLPTLQKTMAEKGLFLEQGPAGGWELRDGGVTQ